MKNLYQKLLFAKSGLASLRLYRSGLYSCLALFSYGFLSILPNSLAADLTLSVSKNQPVASSTAVQIKENPDERCRLQADVTLFLTLQDLKNDAPQSAVPCEGNLDVISKLKEKVVVSDESLNNTVREMTAGYPVEVMAPAIAKYDRKVAALIVGIAKKESNWGKRVPLDKSGADCFNYWGYKGSGTRGIAMGHGCFGSPEEAVTAVGDRLTELVAIRQTSEPKNMIIWKCGSSCATHTSESVAKWISDVDIYYKQIAKE